MANKLLVADSAEDKILELDVEKVSLVMDTFSKANMYLESDTKRGYIKLNAPGLYNFQLPECVRDCVTQNQDDSISTDNWSKEEVNEINLIKTQDVKQLGQLQRDATKGQLCMLLPIEVNLLLNPDSIGNVKQPKERRSNPSTIDSAITLSQSDDVDYSQTTLIDTHIRNANHIQRLHTKEQREVCQFLVPKMNLNFRLTLKIGELNNRDEQPNEDLELAD